ncbi:MAG: metallophosphoesterase [Agathobacter sp.]|uniref:metallophosphoesterase n=1 Tax=Agathobacter sp. TaxID=2021311 RepID=UPI002590F086|nr:metallophosphoesterase [Agathobacter sp.]MCR5677387.1 metallophosphoesterase [Agathobacter sp.]
MTILMVGIVLAIVGTICALCLILTGRKLFKFRILRDWCHENKKRKRIVIAIYLAIVILFGVLDFINTLIVMIHLTVFFFIADFVGFLLKRKIPQERYWTGLIALVVCVGYLGFGWYQAHHVRETDYEIKTAKDIHEDLTVVQITDAHVGATFDGDGFAEHLKKIQAVNPDLVVVTGDFVDDSTSREDMQKSCEALGALQTKYGIYLVWGNHDRGYYRSEEFTFTELKQELRRNQIHILEDEVVEIGEDYYLAGRLDRSFSTRKTAQELLDGLDDSRYVIMLDHQPNDFDAESETIADLVLSGHTHGGQMFPIGWTGVWSGLNDRTYGMEERNDTTFVVSSGISDWAIRFKTATFSEYVVLHIGKQ